LKHPIGALNAYIGSTQFQKGKHQKLISELETGAMSFNNGSTLKFKGDVRSNGIIIYSNEKK
jgi:uncharacterized protein (DUF779 family)